MKKNLIFALGLSLITGFTACSSEIEDGTTDIDSWEMPYEEVVAKYTYTHPCAMFNEADFTRVKTMLDNGSAPQAVKDEFNLLKSSQFTNVTYTPSPTEKIVRGMLREQGRMKTTAMRCVMPPLPISYHYCGN